MLRRAVGEPRHAFRVALALLRGRVCLAWARLRGRRVRGGRGLRIYGRLIIEGPGLVELGERVTIGMTVTPWTTTAEAVIRIGDGTFLNGTRFGCAQRIDVGRRCILAECRVMDTNFHSIHVSRHDPRAPVRVEAVSLGDNVWVAPDAALLPGTRIGADSVVGIGSICSGEFPSRVLVAGNPAVVVRTLPDHPL
jgi:acetyltransferase-like isoleucine patch superfamily enzyme